MCTRHITVHTCEEAHQVHKVAHRNSCPHSSERLALSDDPYGFVAYQQGICSCHLPHRLLLRTNHSGNACGLTGWTMSASTIMN